MSLIFIYQKKNEFHIFLNIFFDEIYIFLNIIYFGYVVYYYYVYFHNCTFIRNAFTMYFEFITIL